jgi:hypothetical protein
MRKAVGPTSKPWCDNFDATMGEEISFPTAPLGATISQSGSVFPFCDANGNTLPSPFNVNGPTAVPIYICSGLQKKSYPFTPGPPCTKETTKSVTITG